MPALVKGPQILVIVPTSPKAIHHANIWFQRKVDSGLIGVFCSVAILFLASGIRTLSLSLTMLT
jgi:hypothetical protein